MGQAFLRAALGAVLLLIVPLFLAAADDDPRLKEQIETDLAVQTALSKGQEHNQRGNYQAAVDALEREVHRISDPRIRKEYLSELGKAYRGYIRELQQDHRNADLYVERLAILDPGSRLERTPPAIAALATQSGKTPAKQPEVRGKIDDKAADNDPFNDANRVQRDARSVLSKADREFKDQHYQAAGRLYQEAHTLDPNATVASRECWAYCKMYGVVEALNQPNGTSTEDLEREVRQAMSMAPKLDNYGQKLLRNLQERAPHKQVGAVAYVEEAKFEMRDGGTQGPWNVLETPNFRILHNQPREVAEKAARIVEQTRKAMSKKWFGDNGEAWNQRCDIYLHATGQDYSSATGKPPQSPGHSTIQAEGERVVMRRVDIHCDDSNWPIGVLPHETTHVVIAGRYGANAVPRWADEGIAVLAEPRDRVERHLRNLPRHRDDHMLFGVGTLMEMNDYPRPQYIGPFYAQSVSLVEYLSSLKGPQEYTAFLRDGLRNGYEPSLKKHFGIESYADLERRWQAYAFNQRSASAD
jgi:tetratricopeptide (TPR) repeat protein